MCIRDRSNSAHGSQMRRPVWSFWKRTWHVASQVCPQGLSFLESISAHGLPDAPPGVVLLESNSAHVFRGVPAGAVVLGI
eukprot:2761068-Karenia_brevis.AAC.1